MLEQRRTERVADTVERLVCVEVHDTIREVVHDTIRETTTVQLNAEGDTTRKETEREHVTDRRRQERNDSVRESTHQERHEKEATKDKKERVVERPNGDLIKSFLWGLVTGVGIIGIIRVIRIIKK